MPDHQGLQRTGKKRDNSQGPEACEHPEQRGRGEDRRLRVREVRGQLQFVAVAVLRGKSALHGSSDPVKKDVLDEMRYLEHRSDLLRDDLPRRALEGQRRAGPAEEHTHQSLRHEAERFGVQVHGRVPEEDTAGR